MLLIVIILQKIVFRAFFGPGVARAVTCYTVGPPLVPREVVHIVLFSRLVLRDWFTQLEIELWAFFIY